ncbi:hypothetical protein [Komagataeibacter diospyri]|uniref:hypothetical protein n=1 Tax=Komagataeibacter diospyri TaxID=1932662 RepID=UPI0018742E70|nr:hypothetical protein [Komagataeibacter diospyri]
MAFFRHFLQSVMKELPWNTFVCLQETIDIIAHNKWHRGPYDLLRPVPPRQYGQPLDGSLGEVVFDDPGRIATDDGIRRYVLRHHGRRDASHRACSRFIASGGMGAVIMAR